MADETPDHEAERMLNAALGHLTPHEALLEASRAESAKTEEKAAAIARNRERALQLLAVLEKNQG